MKNHVLVKSLILSLIVGLVCFFSFKGNCSDLGNVQTIGQKNRNQAVGRGLQIADSGLCKGPFEADSSVTFTGLPPLSPPVHILGVNAANSVVTTQCGCIQHITDTISSSQILNSNSTPITIIPAPGAGITTIVMSYRYAYIYSTANYTISGGTFSDLYEGSTVNPISPIISSSTGLTLALGQSSSRYGYSAIGGTAQTATMTNQAVVFYTTSGNPSGGSGYLIIDVYYMQQ